MRVSIDVFVMILDLLNKEGRKENSNPKKRERELYSRLKNHKIDIMGSALHLSEIRENAK